MARLDILDETARHEFGTPPQFNHEQRKFFFAISAGLKSQIRAIETPTNRVGFMLQRGYFQAGGRFFKPTTFSSTDILYMARQLSVDPLSINWHQYNRKTISYHRSLIRQDLGFIAFDGLGKAMAHQEISQLVSRQVHPEQVFWSICTFLRAHRIEVPPYFTLCGLISAAFSQFESSLDNRLIEHITSPQRHILEELLIKLPDDASGRSIHKLARLKNTQELMRLSVIRDNMSILKDLKTRYQGLLQLLQVLNLSEEMIEYYAEYVLRADVFHVKRRVRKQLILLCFVQYQYFYVSDILVQTFIQATE